MNRVPTPTRTRWSTIGVSLLQDGRRAERTVEVDGVSLAPQQVEERGAHERSRAVRQLPGGGAHGLAAQILGHEFVDQLGVEQAWPAEASEEPDVASATSSGSDQTS